MKNDDIEDLKSQMGVDKYEEMEQALVKDLSDAIDEEILTKLTGMNKEEREKHLKRNEKIDILLDGNKESGNGNEEG